MSDKAKKKEKHRLKRLRKQQQARKAGSITPLHRLAASGGRLECWVNEGWEEQGLATISVLGTASFGRCAYGVFLVDVWCVGLKDAFGRAEFTRYDFDEQLDRQRRSMPVVPLDPDEARRLVAGAIRFSRQNGFKLPPGWDKWVKIFGPLGDIESADLSGFGKDGKLFYVGDERFLRQRLIGQTPQEFFAGTPCVVRKSESESELEGLEIVGDDDEFHDSEEDDDADSQDPSSEMLEAMLQVGKTTYESATFLIGQTTTWCGREGIELHPRVEDAAQMLSAALVGTLALEKRADNKAVAKKMPDMFTRLMENSGERDPESLIAAVEQIMTATKELGEPENWTGNSAAG